MLAGPNELPGLEQRGLRTVSIEYWFRARLDFASDEAVADVHRRLAEEGCAGHVDDLLSSRRVWHGTRLEIDARGWMSYSSFEISSYVLGVFASHAARGEALALNVEDGYGVRYLAGAAEEIELDDDEIAGLRAEYGWHHDP